jgi:CRISPR/Cas system CSM-associated protein Csm3 (group 7 of RAMP superfamily)
LFFKEVVAPKATFGVIMDLDVPPDSTDDGRSLVSATLTLLSAFAMEESSDLPPLTLGAMTGRGFGRFEWTLTAVRRATDTSVKRWLNDGAKGAWDQALEPLPDPEKKAFEQDAAKLRGQGRAGAELVCDVDLAFDFRFLVSEPGRVVTQAQAGNNGKATASIMPKVDREGHAVLPTASIKGVLRSRAERIWATLTTDESPFGHAPGRGPKRLEDPSTQMMAQGLPTERLFGAASWRAALQIDPFTFDEKAGSRPSTQELVAVDRFTGGASGSAKYAIDAFDRPRFSGRLRLDLRRTNDEDLGLLVLLLRDLAEGDLTFGHGATKGYGGAKAAITLRVQGDLSGTPLAGCSLAEGEGLSWGAIADSPLHDPLVKAVEAARGRARDEKAIFQKSEAEKQNRPQQQESA